MPDLAFREYIAKRMAHTRQLAKEAQAQGVDENDVRMIFKPLDFIDITVGVPLIREGKPFFNLDERTIDQAEAEHKNLRFTWPQGSSIHTPQEWRKGAQLTLQAFKYKDNPLRLWGNFLERI